MTTAQSYIKSLHLLAHPEGGFYKETHRTVQTIAQASLPNEFGGDRSLSTAIYFLLDQEQTSAFHRIKSDELWFFHDGSPLTIHVISEDGCYSAHTLGLYISAGQQPQITVPAGAFFGAEVNNKEQFTLCSCTVAPGFDFADFEMPSAENLYARFPQHKAIIECLS